MTYNELVEQIKLKKSFLCVGLDTDPLLLPNELQDHPNGVFEFNKRVIDATAAYTVAYKPNLAFYEPGGAKGWIALEETVQYVKKNYPEIFLIADAKRGDIGNTSKMYARALLNEMPFDSVTVAPYMGEDSVTPFLSNDGKWVVLLALTSNKGADDFQFTKDAETGEFLFQKVLRRSQEWAGADRMMYVCGATRAEMLADIRRIVPNHFLLVPGVGAQGGSLSEVARYGMNDNCGLLVNSSRAIIFASSGSDFDTIAGIKAAEMQLEMAQLLKEKGVL